MKMRLSDRPDKLPEKLLEKILDSAGEIEATSEAEPITNSRDFIGLSLSDYPFLTMDGNEIKAIGYRRAKLLFDLEASSMIFFAEGLLF